MNAKQIVEILKANYKIQNEYEIAFIMGSGLDGAVPDFEDEIVIDYKDTPMPKSKVPGFVGHFKFGKINDKPCIKLTRYHYYESGDISLVRLPFEILKELKVKYVILATSCISINKRYKTGDLLLIKDHINLTGYNPLIGFEPLEFVDMNNAYDADLRKLAIKSSKENNIRLNEVVHLQLSGPTYETPSEIQMAKNLGADTISMSTAYDTICARRMGLKVLAFAFISNMIGDLNVSHDSVLKMAKQSGVKLNKVISNILSNI